MIINEKRIHSSVFFRAIFIMTRELEFALTIENENGKGKILTNEKKKQFRLTNDFYYLSN